jgi:hypothetical protein
LFESGESSTNSNQQRRASSPRASSPRAQSSSASQRRASLLRTGLGASSTDSSLEVSPNFDSFKTTAPRASSPRASSSAAAAAPIAQSSSVPQRASPPRTQSIGAPSNTSFNPFDDLPNVSSSGAAAPRTSSSAVAAPLPSSASAASQIPPIRNRESLPNTLTSLQQRGSPQLQQEQSLQLRGTTLSSSLESLQPRGSQQPQPQQQPQQQPQPQPQPQQPQPQQPLRRTTPPAAQGPSFRSFATTQESQCDFDLNTKVNITGPQKIFDEPEEFKNQNNTTYKLTSVYLEYVDKVPVPVGVIGFIALGQVVRGKCYYTIKLSNGQWAKGVPQENLIIL